MILSWPSNFQPLNHLITWNCDRLLADLSLLSLGKFLNSFRKLLAEVLQLPALAWTLQWVVASPERQICSQRKILSLFRHKLSPQPVNMGREGVWPSYYSKRMPDLQENLEVHTVVKNALLEFVVTQISFGWWWFACIQALVNILVNIGTILAPSEVARWRTVCKKSQRVEMLWYRLLGT